MNSDSSIMILLLGITGIAVLVGFGFGIATLIRPAKLEYREVRLFAALNLLEPSATLLLLFLGVAGSQGSDKLTILLLPGLSLFGFLLSPWFGTPPKDQKTRTLLNVTRFWGLTRLLNTVAIWLTVIFADAITNNSVLTLTAILIALGTAILLISVLWILAALSDLDIQTPSLKPEVLAIDPFAAWDEPNLNRNQVLERQPYRVLAYSNQENTEGSYAAERGFDPCEITWDSSGTPELLRGFRPFPAMPDYFSVQYNFETIAKFNVDGELKSLAHQESRKESHAERTFAQTTAFGALEDFILEQYLNHRNLKVNK